jgi:putative chitinase
MADLKKYLIASGCKPELADNWLLPISNACEKYGIDSNERIAMFLAQTAHESASFTHLVENLNYSAEALRAIFSKYFTTDETAEAYARQPEKIANRVYANRLGNSTEGSGDGWKYRGRGLIQVTGKNNVALFSMKQFGDLRLVTDPSAMENKDLAAASAGWFWWLNGLNSYADRKDLEGATKRINGGLTGLEDRRRRWIAVRASMDLKGV